MELSRTQNSIRNMFWGMMNRIISIVLPFIVRTIFIKAIGEEYLGLNTLYSSVLQVLNLADLGFASAIVASMYKPIADHDIDKISALMNLYRKIYKVIGLFILGVGIVITPFINKLINGTPPADVNIYFLWLLYLVNTVISYLLFAYKVSVLNAHQRNDITEKIGAISRIITSVLQIYVVVILKNIYLYVMLTVLCSIIYNLWCSFECNRLYPKYKCNGTLDYEIKNKISKDIGALAIQKIGNTISLSLDAVVISAFLGLTTVTVYGNYNYIIQAITTFIALIYSAITASIGNSIVLESPEKNYRDFKKIFFLNTWIIGWCSICFICIFQDFMRLWMGESLLFNMSIVFVLVIRFYFDQLRKVVLTYKDAAGMWRIDKWRPLVGCIINLVLNIVLVKKIGVAGVVISTIISYTFIELPWETKALFKNYFKHKEIEYYKEMLSNMFTMIIAGCVTYSICNFVTFTGVLSIIVKLFICIIVPNIIFVVLNLSNENFISSQKLIIKIWETSIKI